MSKHTLRYQWLAALYTTIGMLLYWWQIIKDAHLYLFSISGEGIRNYFTSVYYILNDRDQIFTGFNYPYGEHISYTDSQPLFSLLFSPLLNGNIEYSGNIITVINLLMLVSIPLGAVYLYRLFSIWKMPPWYSTLFAAFIALLSPQVFRFTGQYALSYVCFFPMIWYYSAVWLQEKRISSLIYLFITLIVFGGIHPYYIGIAIVFVIFTVVFFLFYKFKKKSSWSKALILLLVSLVPLLLYNFWIEWSQYDSITDRPQQYFGFYDRVSSFRNVFLPETGLLKDIINIFLPVGQIQKDSYAFVGTASILSTLAGIWVLRDRILEKEVLASSLGVFLLAALMCLFISFCFPFKYLPDAYIPKGIFQFDSLGIFAWVFYYVFSASGAWLLYILSEYFRKKSHSVIASVFIVVIGGIWAYEGLANQKKITAEIKSLGQQTNDFLSFDNSFKNLLLENGIEPRYFQAILAFPYFNVGSGEFDIERSKNTLFYAEKLALEMQIPLAQNHLRKTSLSQTIRSIQLLSHPYIQKEMMKDLEDDRSFLLMTVGNDLKLDEKRLIEKSRLLIQQGNISLYDLPITAFQQYLPNIDSLQKKYSIKKFEDIEVSAANYKSFIWKNFIDKQLSDKSNLLAHYHIPTSIKDSIEVSIWIKIIQDNAGFPLLFVDAYNKNNQIVQRFNIDPKKSTDIVQQYVRASILIPNEASFHSLKVNMSGKDQIISSLMIKPQHQMIWVKDHLQNEYINNYPVSTITNAIQ